MTDRETAPAGAWHFTRYVDGIEMAEDIEIGRERSRGAAIKAALRLCPKMPNTVLVLDREAAPATSHDRMACPKCNSKSGDDWSQCSGACLLPGSPHYQAGVAFEVGYTNHRGEYAIRRIVPTRVWYGSTEWHPEPQWLLRANDLDKGETRDFALQDFGAPAASHDEVMREIADQKLPEELDADAYSQVDFEGAFRECVLRSRATLSHQPGERSASDIARTDAEPIGEEPRGEWTSDRVWESYPTHPAQPSGEEAAVAVKPLEWAGSIAHSIKDYWEAQSRFGNYSIRQFRSGQYRADTPLPVLLLGFFDSLAEAKAAAQADFEKRVLSCLAAPLSRQEVARAERERCATHFDQATWIFNPILREQIAETIRSLPDADTEGR